MKKRSFTMKNQAGLTMVELLIAVVVIALIMAVVLPQAQSVMRNAKIENASKVLLEVIQISRKVFSSAPDYAGLNNTTLYPNLSSAAQGAGTNIKHPWSRTGVTVATASSNSLIQVSFAAVDQAECTGLASQTYNTFRSLTVNGTAITNPGVASTTCNATGNTLVWQAE